MCQLLAVTKISKFIPQYNSFVKFDVNILWGISQQGPNSVYKVIIAMVRECHRCRV
jgi:hypothetical protein